MPRQLAAAAFVVASLLPLALGPVLAAMPTNQEIVPVAESFGLTCQPPEDTGDGTSHLSCTRTADPSAGTNIDVSVTYNVISTDDQAAFATIASYTTPPAADWLDLATAVATLFCEESTESVRSAVTSRTAETALNGCTIEYTADELGETVDVSPRPPSAAPSGTTLVDPVADAFVAAARAEGLSCEISGPGLTFCLRADDLGSIDTSVYYDAATVSMTARNIETSGSSQVPDRFTAFLGELIAVAPGSDEAPLAWIEELVVAPPPDASIVHEGWRYVWATSVVVTSDGPDFPVTELTIVREPPADLASYLQGYGLTCTADGTECLQEVTDEDGLDATYTVVTTRNEAGDVVGIEAVVVSLDASMPSDAGGLLRGVAERAPVDDPTALVTWFDTAVGDPAAAPYQAGDWSATWSAVAAQAGGETWTLAILRDDAGAEPGASPGLRGGGGAGAPVAPADNAGRPFAASVPAPSQVSTDPVVLLQSAALAALLVFLMPFPSQLFNSTLESHEDEVRRWFRLDRLGAVAGGIGAFWSSWPGVVLFTLLAALLYGFLDPGFGFSLGSLATFAGMLLGIVLVTAAFAIPAVLAHWRLGDRPSVKVVPISLLVGVACVLLSRLTGFQPGYLYGLLIGLAFAHELSAAEEGRATAIGAALMLAVAFGAWLALGALPEGEAFGLVVARTALAALMVAGLEGVVFGLLPMRFLPGEPLYAWNRLLWGALLLVGAFAFFHILINPASGYLSDTSRTPLFTVLALLVGFSLVSVAFWAWFRFRSPSAELPSEG